MNNIIGLIVSILYIALIIVSAKAFENAGKEGSRKFIHIMLSNWWIIAIVFFDNPWCAALLPAAFVVINYLSYKKDIIDVMERDVDDENKNSLGTVYYAISLLVLALITFGPLNNPYIGLVGIIVMGYGDGFAAVVGKAVKSKEYRFLDNKKTVAGTFTMFMISLIIMLGFFYYYESGLWIIKGIGVALLATVAETVSLKGTDNLTIPLVTSLLAAILV